MSAAEANLKEALEERATTHDLDVDLDVDAESEPDRGNGADYEPKVIVFSCNWCSYTSADRAGVNRDRYPENVRVIRFMCSGRVEPQFILKAFEFGADGVIVTGCRMGECHYLTGNEKAKARLEMTAKLLETLGLGAQRLGWEWMSAAEGAKFAATVTDFTEQIRALGPNPILRRAERG